jgi:hypothetical protein
VDADGAPGAGSVTPLAQGDLVEVKRTRRSAWEPGIYSRHAQSKHVVLLSDGSTATVPRTEIRRAQP